MAKPIPSVQDMTANWVGGISSPETARKVAQGIARVTESPGVKAAEKSSKWQANVSSARARARFEANSRAVPLDGAAGWRTAMREAGIQNMASSAQRKAGKYAAKMATVRANLEIVTNEVRQMPNNTPQEREARALTQMRRMRELSAGPVFAATYAATQ